MNVLHNGTQLAQSEPSDIAASPCLADTASDVEDVRDDPGDNANAGRHENDPAIGAETREPRVRVTGRGKRRQRRIEDSARRRAARAAAEATALSAGPPEPATAWDAFYALKPTFFKDRHLLRAALPEIMPPAVRADPRAHIPPLCGAGGGVGAGGGGGQDDCSLPLVLVEAGCGVGNALFPVLRANPAAFAFAFDFSATAIALLHSSPEYDPARADAFVADLARPESYVSVVLARSPADYVLTVWALSALPPGPMLEAAASGLAQLLRPGGMVLLRDYADGDMRMHMFRERGQDGGPSGRLFTRGDQTWAYFFTVGDLSALMGRAGLDTVECRVEERVVENRKNGVKMHRRWLVGRFQKPLQDGHL
jgi:methyltransferase-like protein 6